MDNWAQRHAEAAEDAMQAHADEVAENERLRKRIAELEAESRRTQELCDKAIERANELEDVDAERDRLLAANVSLREALEKAKGMMRAVDSNDDDYAPPLGFYAVCIAIDAALAQPATTEALERVRKEAKADVSDELADHFNSRAFHVGGTAEKAFLEAEETCRAKAAELRGGE